MSGVAAREDVGPGGGVEDWQVVPVLGASAVVVESALPRRVRGIRQWAEEEVSIPDGPYRGMPFRVSRQPVAGHYLDAIDSGMFSRMVLTGPPQSGKSFVGYGLPICWGLCELRETVFVGLPDMNMAGDKWRVDLLPILRASGYRELLPTRGPGSRGGTKVEVITLQNGSELKFTSGAGGSQGDAKRAGYTARLVATTETDKFAGLSASSPEADPVRQIEARFESYGSLGQGFHECTVTTETGRIWSWMLTGTGSNPAALCPHCGTFVMLGRNNLIGWQDAESEYDVRKRAAFACPSCGSVWSEDDRREAVLGSRIVHGVWRGTETMEDEQRQQGRVFTLSEVGAPPAETLTFSMRYSSVDNLFRSAGDLALQEWEASRASNEESAKRALLQFGYALPTRSDEIALTNLDKRVLCERQWEWGLGEVPPSTACLTAFVDLGKRLLDFVVVAWLEDGRCGVCGYGEVQVRYVDHGVEEGILLALHEFGDWCEEGLPVAGASGEREVPDLVLVDSGHWKDIAYRFCRERGPMYRPSKGYGLSQDMAQRYTAPKSKGKTLVAKGPGYHVTREVLEKVELVHIDADVAKSTLFDMLSKPVGQVGAMELGAVDSASAHLAFVNQLTSEKPVEEFLPGVGTRIKWVKHGRMNHKLDGGAGNCVAGRLKGAPAFGFSDEPAPVGGNVMAPGAGPGAAERRPFVSRRAR